MQCLLMILINGNPEHCIETSDRGLQYGDGLFETIAVKQGRPVNFQTHLQRLQLGCERLFIPCPALDLLTREVDRVIENSPPAVLKIIVTRGSGGRGYRQPEFINPTRIISLHPFPDFPNTYKEQGINARFCESRLGINSTLAGIKHLNRLEQILARAEWSDNGIQEGLMSDCLGRVIEGTMSNLFFVKSKTLYTSPITHSGVAGVMRGIVIELARRHGVMVKQEYFDQAQLLAADELFVTNSVIGIWPVKQLDKQKFSVGSITQQIMVWLDQRA